VTLEYDTCQNNGWSGIAPTGETVSVLRHNDCSYNTWDGIEVSVSAQATLEDNTCLHNIDSGIWFRDSTGGSADGNECAFGTYGIRVSGSAHPSIGTNNLHDNTHNLATL
jgi:parallel beta-helix repeat protein